jgi:hypothetical protein
MYSGYINPAGNGGVFYLKYGEYGGYTGGYALKNQTIILLKNS